MMSVQHVIDRLYPYHLFLGKEGRTAVKDMLKVSMEQYIYIIILGSDGLLL